VKRFVLTTLSASVLAGAGCGVDPQIWGNFTKSDFKQPPGAGTQTVTGKASVLGSGASVGFYTAGGIALADQGATTSEGGAFSSTFPATTAFVNTIVVANGGPIAVWGIVPQVPKKATVYDDSITVAMGTDLPGASGVVPVAFMDDLDVDSTAAMLLLMAKQRYAEPPSTLAALSPEAVVDALAEIESLFSDNEPRLGPLRAMVALLASGDITTKPALRPFPATGESYLDVSALAAGADYTGDDTADVTSDAFDAALEAAIGALEFDVCYSQDTIRVVLIADFRAGGKDRNCSNINRFKWTIDAADKRMFITGALHESTPNCDVDPQPCIDSATFDAAGQQMGNWSPNTIPMYDDGTHGDAVSGDNLWTITLDLPWFDAGATSARWVRIGYKYTWGSQGALWTGSEEWPGNQRILELRDVNGDHMIVRQDFYGDETSNKDKSNLLGPAKGGCGTVLWQSDLNPPPEGRRANCVDDTFESLIDTDGDCKLDPVLDSFPTDFSAAPITLPCEE